MATRSQITAAIDAFQAWVRKHLDCDLPPELAKAMQDPMHAALRAADAARPVTIQDRNDIEREAGHLSVRIEAWDLSGNEIEEVLVASNNFLIAGAALDQAVRSRPTSRITLRHGAHVIEERLPEGNAVSAERITHSRLESTVSSRRELESCPSAPPETPAPQAAHRTGGRLRFRKQSN